MVHRCACGAPQATVAVLGTEKSGDSRWIDLYEDDGLDEQQMTAWIKQAAALPGWTP
jgi:hypothetical protein